ncbi:unnamed protein product [Symbiodinium natans]|uniref:Zinc-ribbon domain-containing protein n=1 Tax=Symbiodinium natans TaxID=878477 RepID=A0A812PHJ4_9DINO|nr:unnamed protein product [Symbiodinium natans]
MAASGGDLAGALQEAAAKVSEIIARAEWLLDPTSPESKAAAEGARSFVKLFFDEGQVRSPETLRSTAKDLPRLVVDGFDREQIWEEVEVQNVPLRQHLRKRVSKLAVAPKGAIDLTLATSQTSQAVAEEGEDAAGEAMEELPAETPTKPTTCPACGNKYLEDAIFCRKCGRKRDEVDEAESKDSSKKGAPKAEAADEQEEALGDVPQDEADKAGVGTRDQAEEDFFSLEDMEKFADIADKGTMRLDEDAEESDFDLLEAGDADGDDEAANVTFADFFGAPDGKVSKPAAEKAAKASQGESAGEEELEEEEGEEEEEEEDAEPGALGELDEEEKALEAQLKALQAQGNEDDEGEEEEEKEIDEEGEVTGKEDDGGGKSSSKGKERSLYEMDRRLQSLEEEVRKLEEEQLQEKSWEMKGEVTARHRPLNSLLEVALDQPMTHFAARRAEETGGDAELDEQASTCSAILTLLSSRPLADVTGIADNAV